MTQETECRGCKAPIVWLKLNGRWHPCEPKRLTIVVDNRIVSGHESHFAYCTKASAFRRSR